MPPADAVPAADLAAVAEQLGRQPRGMVAVAARCPCGRPAVVTTAPRLPDGTPFPTLYYLCCTRLNARLSTLESEGLMRDLESRLAEDSGFADSYRAAHVAYLADREALAEIPEIAGFSAGGMPDRVKCLHALAAHSLAAGRGVNPAGDAALEEAGRWWEDRPCG